MKNKYLMAELTLWTLFMISLFLLVFGNGNSSIVTASFIEVFGFKLDMTGWPLKYQVLVAVIMFLLWLGVTILITYWQIKKGKADEQKNKGYSIFRYDPEKRNFTKVKDL